MENERQQLINDTLASIYYTDKKLVGANKLFRLANERLGPLGIKIGSNDAQRWLNEQESVQLLRQNKKPKKYTTIKSSAPLNNYQGDFIIYDRYSYTDSEGREWRNIFAVIDVYSRYLTLVPMQTKNQDEGSRILRTIFTQMGVPKNWNSDLDFNARKYLQLFEEHDVKTYFSQRGETNKGAIIERANRTVQLYLQKFRLILKHNRWVEYLDDVQQLYNSTIHSTTKETPSDVFFGRKLSQQIHRDVDVNFIPGDKVRIKLQKQMFQKGDVFKYSKKVYTIHEINGNNITLKDPNGRILVTPSNEPKRFKLYDLQLSNTINKNVAEDNDNEDDDLEEVHEIVPSSSRTTTTTSNTSSSSNEPRRSARIIDQQTEETPLQIRKLQQVTVRDNDNNLIRGIVEKILQSGQEKERVRYIRSNSNIPIQLSIRVDGNLQNFSIDQVVDGSFPLTRSERSKRIFKIGDIVQTYFKDSDNNLTLRDRNRKKTRFWAEITQIYNTKGEPRNSIRVSEQEPRPRFDLFYFGQNKVLEKVPFSRFV